MATVIDAATGIVLAELIKVVVDAKNKVEMFETILASMESTLTSVTRELEKIKVLNKELDCENDEEMKILWEQIEKGKKVILKCTQINCSSCFKKTRYLKDLQQLDDSLKRFCQIVMPVLQARIQRQALAVVIDTHEDVKDLQDDVKDISKEVKVSHDLVKDLHDEVKDISTEVKQVDEIRDVVENTHSDVKGIDSHVKEVLGEVRRVPEMHEEVKETHADVKGIGKQVKEISKGMNDLRSNIKNGKPTNLLPCMPPEPPEVTFGLNQPLEDLKNEMFKDGMSVIVLTAPGGCGKTTLAKMLCQDGSVKEKFKDNIFFVTISKAPNLKAIIQQLCQHKGYPVHEFQTDEEAKHRLGQLLKQMEPKPILLVLDDVWPISESILDKFKFQIPDYKILVTSRSALPRFGSTYKVTTLNKEESMSLFRHSAGLQDGTSDDVDDDTVEKIVNFCKGFPLALTVVGRSLRGQPEAIWRDRVRKWSRRGSIFESNIDLRDCLQSSLDSLDHKLKECYMDLGAFPEGQLIPSTAVIDMWEELYGLNGEGVTTIANLHELSSLNLVNLVPARKDAREVEGYYNDHFVTQHDLLRELVNHLTGLDGEEPKRKRLFVDINANQFPSWWSQTISSSLLSISTDEIFSSNWPRVHAPKVEVLVLNFHSKNYTLPKFMKNMDNLKALIVTNYSFLPTEISNFAVLANLYNLNRIRLEQVSIPSLALTCEQLEKLQKISLFRCDMVPSFGDNSIQISEALPNLQEINISYCDNLVKLPTGLCDIVCLKKLCITYCHDLVILPQEIGKLVNLEVLMLSTCINLSELPETIGSLHNLTILDISECVNIKNFPVQIGDLRKLRKLYMTGCSNCKLPKSVTNLVHLKLVVCDEETAKLWNPFKRNFSNLTIKC